MDLSANDPKSFYASQGLISDPRDQAEWVRDLPRDIPALCKVVQGLLIHPLLTHLYGVELTSMQRKELTIRPVSEMLRQVRALDPQSPNEPRAPAERLVGNCRDHALLLCSFLRHEGIPARARAGFAAYLGSDLICDHWITEVWQADAGNWIRVDPQIDTVQKDHFKLTFEPANLPSGQFFSASEAWSLCRARKANSGKFGINRKLRGWTFLRNSLLRDLASLNKIELLATDGWWDLGKKDESDITADERRLLDEAAALSNNLDHSFSEMRSFYEGHSEFSSPVQSMLRMLGIEKTVPEIAVEQIESSVSDPGALQAALAHPIFQPSDLERLSSPNLNQASGLSSSPAQPNGTNGSRFKNGETDCIQVRGAQQHNLRHIDVTIPRNKLVVLTGVSGSGKSSLAFDTLYAEGQRRYVESLNAYVRRYLDQMDKPKVDYIGGLSPAISIEQKTISKNPRSTVGTVTEIMDYLRVLFSRAGTQHCPQCGRAIQPASPQVIFDALLKVKPGTRFQLMAPLVRSRKGDHRLVLEKARQDGYIRFRIDGQVTQIDQDQPLPRLVKSHLHTIEIIIDRLVSPPSDAPAEDRQEYNGRLIDSIETTLRIGSGVLAVDLGDPEPLLLTEHNSCPNCQLNLQMLTPGLFSFNSPSGMCPDCNGLGTRLDVDVEHIVEHPELSLMEGASRWYGNLHKKKSWHGRNLEMIASHYGVDLERPWKDLPKKFRDVILWGSGDEKIHFQYENEEGTWKGESTQPVRGIVYNINRLFRQTKSEYTRRFYVSFMSQQPCPACRGTRLCVEARNVTLGGKTFGEVLDQTIEQAYHWVTALANGGDGSSKLSTEMKEVVGEVLKEIRSRLQFMLNVGLHYLTLSRPAPTLSGGEGQRIRLASQLGCGLVGVLYILDEPSIGLHARDQRSLLTTLTQLRDLGNTVLVVEHDAETMRAADWLIDLGPGAGVMGGCLVAAGTPSDVAANSDSLTGRYLSGALKVTAPNNGRRRPARGWLTLTGARLFNLKNVTARFPLGVITCVTGVSGSGKSSLVSETLYPALSRLLMGAQSTPGPYDRLDGVDQIDKVIDITQEPIGRTPRSNPATYVGIFDEIRQVFASVPEARLRGYKPDRFSFNVKGGRCEACRGHGLKKIEMHFLPDVWVTCQECKGARYNRHTLEITYKGKTIADALNMDVQEALEFFGAFPAITRVLQTLHDVGLDYVKLGQSATTLSGGEAQRVKLARELGRVSTGDTLYILDEPTTGLHFADIQRLLDVLHRLADAGNTIIVIEHNLDVIKTSDWILDMGPEGGAAGGQILTEGTPEQVSRIFSSYTGQFLREAMDREN